MKEIMKKFLAKLIILSAILILSATYNTIKADAKTILVPFSKCTDSFVHKHKNDKIIAYVYGTRTHKNGDGKNRDGGYIKYPKGKRGVKYTSIFIYNDNPKGCDDFDIRFDYKGWKKPRLH